MFKKGREFKTILVALVAMIMVLEILHGSHQENAESSSQTFVPMEALALASVDLQKAMSILEECFAGPVDLNRIQSVPVTLTAYSSSEDQCDDTPHITASNKPVRIGIVAVSQDLMENMGLSFGQRVLIPGHGLFEVLDRMNRRWERRVDIWYDDREAAMLFGKQKGSLIWITQADDHRKDIDMVEVSAPAREEMLPRQN